jgi:hypothetical protein
MAALISNALAASGVDSHAVECFLPPCWIHSTRPHSTRDSARRAAHLPLPLPLPLPLTPAQTAERGTRAERCHDSSTALDPCDAP